jgi:fatty-acyl-CoA synthase
MGEVGVAFVVARGGAEVASADLIALIAGRLARFKVPRHLFIVPADFIPTTASGRARKFLLAEKAREMVGQ